VNENNNEVAAAGGILTMLHLLSHVDNECKLLSSTILTCLAMIHFVQGKTGTRQTNILRGSAGKGVGNIVQEKCNTKDVLDC
jgi:hypothetical protein